MSLFNTLVSFECAVRIYTSTSHPSAPHSCTFSLGELTSELPAPLFPPELCFRVQGAVIRHRRVKVRRVRRIV